METDDWENTTVVVTGAARGQGAAEAALFAEAGANVVAADIDAEAVSATAAGIGGRVTAVGLDVTSDEGWRRLAGDLADGPPVRVLVNNAGIHWFRPLHDEPAENLERMLRVNLIGPHLGMRHLAPLMRRAGGGSIVNICSVVADRGAWNASSYVVSKWALRGLTKAAALELGPWGIRVNAVLPGYVDTPMLSEIAGGGRPADYYDFLPLGRPSTPGEVAEAVLFLASRRSSSLTGTDLVVDGGLLALPGMPPPQRVTEA
ncbi:SDR family oxidoreductase [Actinomadura sp. NBRC 104412]|uniref:SDR family NAD(P)-dependent oxidoreductase n=1 Tax=Actinomadura sp. NBRC 104412 TaxID=3032203 RepID=UPI002556AB72|nr:SDR family oxidoreductase [Actinomadura sp. NBRC 104412]